MAPSATQTAQDNTLNNAGYIPTKFASRVDGGDYASLTGGSMIAGDMIMKTMQERVNGIDEDTCEPNEEDAFFVADLGEVYRQHLRWKMNLKRIKPHYGELYDTTLSYTRKF